MPSVSLTPSVLSAVSYRVPAYAHELGDPTVAEVPAGKASPQVIRDETVHRIQRPPFALREIEQARRKESF